MAGQHAPKDPLTGRTRRGPEALGQCLSQLGRRSPEPLESVRGECPAQQSAYVGLRIVQPQATLEQDRPHRILIEHAARYWRVPVRGCGFQQRFGEPAIPSNPWVQLSRAEEVQYHAPGVNSVQPSSGKRSQDVATKLVL